MKKVVMCLAAIALACAANAALAVTWKTGVGVKDVSGNAFTTATTGYTATIKFFSDAACTTEITGVTGTSATKYATKGSAGFSGTTSAAFDAGTYYAKITVTEDATGKFMTSDAGSFTIAAGALTGPTLNFTTGSDMGGSNLISSTTYAGGSGGGGVPEPTSGLLLVLGGAMLALRRKQK